MKTLIAVPCFDMVPTDFVKCFVALDMPPGTDYTFLKNTMIYNARNTIAANAVKLGFDRVLWLDSDVTFKPDTLTRLSACMDQNGFDMVSGLYFTRKDPPRPVIFDNLLWNVRDDGLCETGASFYEHYPFNAVFPVAGCGFGCVMTSVKLLEKVGQKYGAPFTPLFGLGEDLSFCHRVSQEGFSIYCDSRVKCGHIGQKEFTEDEYIQRGLHPVAP